MGIRTSFDGLRSVFGVGEIATVSPGARPAAAEGAVPAGDDLAILSEMGSAMAMSGSGGVRPGKIAGVQAAMASGGYSVPASAVAGRIVDFMLGTSA